MNDIIIPECRDRHYTIFTKSQCKYCDNIKSLMIEEKEDVEYISCDEMLRINRDSFIDFMKKRTNVETITFPIVFYNGVYVGGYDDYHEKVKQRCFDNLDFENDMF